MNQPDFTIRTGDGVIFITAHSEAAKYLMRHCKTNGKLEYPFPDTELDYLRGKWEAFDLSYFIDVGVKPVNPSLHPHIT